MGSLFLIGCDFTPKETCAIHVKLAKEQGIDSSNLVYQYYQKYGFTDVCEDLRMVAKNTRLTRFDKTLPLSAQDRQLLHSFSNKMDRLVGNQLVFTTHNRIWFRDIELDFVEFKLDSGLLLNLEKGTYQITQSEFVNKWEVLDENSGLYYVEIHRCDGR